MITTQTIPSSPSEPSETFLKSALISGKPGQIECVELAGQTYSITRGALTVVRLEDEWYEDIHDPVSVIDALRTNANVDADVFTFWQRFPDVAPKYSFH